MASSSLLDELLQAWKETRAGVIDELKNLPEKSFDFRPAPGTRSVTELAQHLVASGLLMTGELTRAGGDFTRKPYEALLGEHAPKSGALRGKRALLAALRRTHAEGEKKIRTAGELHMLQRITQFNGVPATRLSWMAHAVAHEEYHRGQLALYARLLGRVPALTQLIQGG